MFRAGRISWPPVEGAFCGDRCLQRFLCAHEALGLGSLRGGWCRAHGWRAVDGGGAAQIEGGGYFGLWTRHETPEECDTTR